MSYLKNKNTSLDENLVVYGAVTAPLLTYIITFLLFSIFIHPAFCILIMTPGLVPGVISMLYIYHEKHGYLDSVLLKYRKVKRHLLKNKRNKVLHKRFPDIGSWKEGDRLKGCYYDKQGNKKSFKYKNFVSISGPKTFIIRRHEHSKYKEISTKQVISLENEDLDKRLQKRKDKKLKEKAKKTTKYETFLEAKENALEDIRNLDMDEKEEIPEIKGSS